LRAR